MRRLLCFVECGLRVALGLGVIAAMVGLGYGVWVFWLLFSRCGAEVKVIVITMTGFVGIGVILFLLSSFAHFNQRLRIERYRREIDAYCRLLSLLSRMLQAGKGRRLVLLERDKEELNRALLEIGVLSEVTWNDELGNFRQVIGDEKIPIHELFNALDSLLLGVRRALGTKNIYHEKYDMNRLWIDRCDEIIMAINSMRYEKDEDDED